MSIPDKSWQPPYVTLDTTMGEVSPELILPLILVFRRIIASG
jgi:hypothetical protein